MKITHCPQCGCDLRDPANDGRAEMWRIRVRLYDTSVSNSDPMAGADSDWGRPADAPGETVVRGLASVFKAAVEAAESYHGLGLYGLGPEVQELKVRGIRPTLSRNKGRGVMRIPYGTASLAAERYLARVDILKEETAK